jgi:hypothetical protein
MGHAWWVAVTAESKPDQYTRSLHLKSAPTCYYPGKFRTEQACATPTSGTNDMSGCSCKCRCFQSSVAPEQSHERGAARSQGRALYNLGQDHIEQKEHQLRTKSTVSKRSPGQRWRCLERWWSISSERHCGRCVDWYRWYAW